MNYHPFNDEGHHCPTCGGLYLCTMEDGQCENMGECSRRITKRIEGRTADMDPRDVAEMEHQMEMQERGY